MSNRLALASLFVLATTSLAALQAGGGKDAKPGQAAAPAAQQEPKGLAGTEVVLTKRLDDGPYEKSAYSFRYMTQDVAIHKNEVDIVYSACGQFHVQPGANLKNKITKVPGMTLDEVQTWPNTGWKTSSIEITKNQLYVMEVDDGVTKMRVRFRVTTVNAAEIHLEWLPFRDMGAGLSGTLSHCTGKHAVK